MPSVIEALTVERSGDGSWTAPPLGPAGKRAYGGQTCAQALAAARHTVPDVHVLRAVHAQFLRAGDAGTELSYVVEDVHSGRTASTRRVIGRKQGRSLIAVKATFSEPVAGIEHGCIAIPHAPTDLPMTGPPGPALALPPDAFDIRITDDGEGPAFVRRMWWRYLHGIDDPFVHTAVALFVSDLYVLDVAVAVHGIGNDDRTMRRATTDWSVWFHRPVRADRWNVLELRSPAAADGRGIVTGSLAAADGTVLATSVQEGVVARRETGA